MVILYVTTIFVSAWLLFLVQPMFARMILPLLGGSPAVWNTAMVFYQGVLLVGYAYAHVTSRRLGMKRQVLLHPLVLLLPLLVLPLGVPEGWSPPRESTPVWWMLALMTVSVGLPFFVISTSSPILQRWFAASGHKDARDPYFLYAASNVGSLLALLCYPLVVEPLFSVVSQRWIWSGGYFLLIVLMWACAWRLWRRGGIDLETPPSGESPAAVTGRWDAAPITPRRRSRWVLLAFVPSSLMLSVTSYISSEVASMPLLWVIPLSLYLASFILVFARRRPLPHAFILRALPIAVVALSMLLAMRATQPILLLMLLHLAAFFISAMACHGELADDRPGIHGLTEFYLWMSVGGVLGGVFNALVAPLVFTSIAEYPIGIALGSWLGLGGALRGVARHDLGRHLLAAGAVGGGTLGIIWLLPGGESLTSGTMTFGLLFAAPALACYFLSKNPLRFALAVGAMLLAAQTYKGALGSVLFAERSFFGIHRITLDPARRLHFLVHGKTVHGMQFLDAEQRGIPLTYYHPEGPCGEFFRAYPERFSRVAALGLGAGSMVAYGGPRDRWTFYEIDPVVKRVATDERYFAFLGNASCDWDIVLGDARRSLEEAPDGSFDLVVVDVYSSDAIPVHLITREAVQLYLAKLDTNGMLLFNVSNRHFEIHRILGSIGLELGLNPVEKEATDVGTADLERGHTGSHWMAMARKEQQVGVLRRNFDWKDFDPVLQIPVWSDNYSNLLPVLRINND